MFTGDYRKWQPVLKLIIIVSLLLGFSSSHISSAEETDYVSLAPKASFQISENGQAGYNIPIEVAPGPMGLKPEFSLQYSSGNTSNGVLGVGFNLAGLSRIHRCGKSRPVEGDVGAITFTITDRLCLNGNQLLPWNQTGPRNHTNYNQNYWQPSMSFYTEQESWSRIRASGNCSWNGISQPCRFTVLNKNGSRLEYGFTEDSSVERQGNPNLIRTWMLNKVIDRNGNQMSLQYNIRSNTPYLTRVTYGKNDLRFTYANTNGPDMIFSWAGGLAGQWSDYNFHYKPCGW